MKIGIFPGKFLPPHIGHIRAMVEAATMCDLLYMMVCENNKRDEALCSAAGLKYISGLQRYEWLSREFQGVDTIKVVYVDDNSINQEPFDFEDWSKLVRSIVKEDISYIFSSEDIYEEFNKKYFSEAKSVIIDLERKNTPISATKIRSNPYEYWDYIPKHVKPFFVKKILLAGTESCGKSTFTKYLGARYATTVVEEFGREYPRIFLGSENNDICFKDSDFGRLALIHYEKIYNAACSANKVVFVDTDAVVTQYWSEIYMGHKNAVVEGLINPDDFDKVVLLAPTVPWVDDGTRFIGEQEKRIKMHEKMKKMYLDYGFGPKLIEITNPDYNSRLNKVIEIVDKELRGISM